MVDKKVFKSVEVEQKIYDRGDLTRFMKNFVELYMIVAYLRLRLTLIERIEGKK